MRFVFIIIIICVGLFTHTTNSLAQAPSAFDLMKPAHYSGAALSPNGQFLAVVSTKTAKFCIDKAGRTLPAKKTKCKDRNRLYRSTHRIVVIDVNSKAAIANVSLGENIDVQNIQWANDDRILMALSVPITIGESGFRYNLGGSRILSMTRTGEDIVVMFNDSRSVMRSNWRMTAITNLLRDEPDYILMPAYKGYDLDLWKVNVNTGESERIAIGKPGTFYWYTDPDGKPTLRFDANRSGTKITVYSWSDEEQS